MAFWQPRCTFWAISSQLYNTRPAAFGSGARDAYHLQSKSRYTYMPAVPCLCYVALSEWHLGEIASCQATIAEATALAKELNDMHALVLGTILCSDSRPL